MTHEEKLPDSILAPALDTIWTCKIGVLGKVNLAPGADLPMRRAVEAEFQKVAGCEYQFLFSGWGGSLTHGERFVVTPDDPVAREGLQAEARQAEQLAEKDATIAELVQGLASLSKSKSDTFTARNGKRCSIEGDDGEKCWLIPFDEMATIEALITKHKGGQENGLG